MSSSNENTTEPVDHTSTTEADTPIDNTENSVDDAAGTYDGDDPKIARAFKDAKRFRLQLRETEAERETLRTTLDEYHRADAERVAGQYLADGSDLWRDGATITDLLGEDGRIDTERVTTAVRSLTEAHPHWAKGTNPRPAVESLKSGNHLLSEKKDVGWSAALRGDGM